ncbi:hypothetical protein EB796_010566 [Bugula neritina]|uniref:Ankyrin repeat, SAM and basic leucine zipper domain-containing protein 1 n=1 Tax=Bugula neritina TaxID=10212 RepID=A0A7J7JXG3_BUGNE|nr:hypothetical protein EB796_010566 [Bugula neritina]
MAAYAPPPAEEYSDSDSDDFLFPASETAHTNTYNFNSAYARGGFNNSSNDAAGRDGGWTVGEDASSFKRSSAPKSKIPVSSPTNHGVNIEDFRLAVIRGSVESARQCLEQGVDVNIKFRTGWTALMYAAHQMNESLLSLLLSHGADPGLGSTTALMTCCTSNVMNRPADVERCVQMLITHGADVNLLDRNGMSPLMMAAKKGHAGAVKVLVEAGAEVNLVEKRGYTPLCWACSNGSLESIQTLAQHGADVNVQTLQGQSPYSLARSSNNFSQISTYFNSLPEFHKVEEESEDNSLPAAAPSMSNGPTAVTNDQPDSTTATPQDAASAEDARIDTVYNKFGDVEIFLHGMELSSLIPCFQQHSITMSHLLSITDEELVKIGVVSVGHRKQILDSVHELHKKDWQPSSIPSYETVKMGKVLSCAEVTTIIANLASHSACMNSTLRYLTSQIHTTPSLLQVDKHGRGLHALRRFLHEMEGNTNTQVDTCSQLKTEILKCLGDGSASTNDHITRETTDKSGNKLIIFSAALVTLGVVSLGAFVLAKKFPHLGFSSGS